MDEAMEAEEREAWKGISSMEMNQRNTNEPRHFVKETVDTKNLSNSLYTAFKL
jgi:hypothetical protein